LQVASHVTSCIEKHTYMSVLLPAWSAFQRKLLGQDMDLCQCAQLYVDFAADCALQSLQASDVQLSVVVAELLATCQQSSGILARTLLGVSASQLDSCIAVPFENLAERVLDDEVWSEMQAISTDIKARVSFVKHRVQNSEAELDLSRLNDALTNC
jgi:hypothetical protein